MNTKLIPAVLALVAGFITCIMSFVQQVDMAIFARRFVIVCIIFFVIGTVISVIINMNFKDMAIDDAESPEAESEETPEEEEAAIEDENS